MEMRKQGELLRKKDRGDQCNKADVVRLEGNLWDVLYFRYHKSCR